MVGSKLLTTIGNVAVSCNFIDLLEIEFSPIALIGVSKYYYKWKSLDWREDEKAYQRKEAC